MNNLHRCDQDFQVGEAQNSSCYLWEKFLSRRGCRRASTMHTLEEMFETKKKVKGLNALSLPCPATSWQCFVWCNSRKMSFFFPINSKNAPLWRAFLKSAISSFPCKPAVETWLKFIIYTWKISCVNGPKSCLSDLNTGVTFKNVKS